MATNTRTSIKTAIDGARRARLDLPEAFTARFDEIGTQAAAVQIAPDDAALVAAIVDAQAKGRDPLTDAAVKRHALASTIASRDLRGASEEWAESQYRDLLDTHADDLFDAITAASKALGEALTDAHEVLGDMSLEDSSAAILKGDKYVNAWRTANDGIARWGYLERTWTQLATALRMRLPRGRGSLMRSPDYGIANRHKVPENATPWELVADYSLTLALPTRSEWRDRFQGLDSDIETNNAKVEALEIRELLRWHSYAGPGLARRPHEHQSHRHRSVETDRQASTRARCRQWHPLPPMQRGARTYRLPDPGRSGSRRPRVRAMVARGGTSPPGDERGPPHPERRRGTGHARQRGPIARPVQSIRRR